MGYSSCCCLGQGLFRFKHYRKERHLNTSKWIISLPPETTASYLSKELSHATIMYSHFVPVSQLLLAILISVPTSHVLNCQKYMFPSGCPSQELPTGGVLHKNLWEQLFFPSFLRIAVIPPKMLVVIKTQHFWLRKRLSRLGEQQCPALHVCPAPIPCFSHLCCHWWTEVTGLDRLLFCSSYIPTSPVACNLDQHHRMASSHYSVFFYLFAVSRASPQLVCGKDGLFCSCPVQRQPGRDLLCALGPQALNLWKQNTTAATR